MKDKEKTKDTQWYTYEVFHQSNDGEAHIHVGNVHAPDREMALMSARDVFVRRFDCISLWVVRTDHIFSSNSKENEVLFEPAKSKMFRHPKYYQVKTQQREIKEQKAQKEKEI